MGGARGRGRAGICAAIAVSAVLLVLPAPNTGPAAGSTAEGSRNGATTLAEAWPDHRPVTLPRARPDGSSFEPRLVLDANRAVGLLTSADDTAVSLVVLTFSAPDAPRVLAATAQADHVVFDAVTVRGDTAYWMTTTPDGDGISGALWAADLSAGPTRLVTADTGRAAFRGSQYDLQVVNGRVYWAAVRSVDPVVTEIRSIAEADAGAGAPVRVLALDRSYSLTAVPWITSEPGRGGVPLELRNLETGRRVTLAVGPEERAWCTPTWCRTSGPGPLGDILTLARPDAGERRRITYSGDIGVADVAIADRFEILTTPLPTRYATTRETLVLYDLRTGRAALVAVVTSRSARDGWLWWETTDGESATWHLLDLTSLP
ncbi:MAG: hypothetical protein HKP61_18115 [Dactylosporangium sp.]|nr:hypothetical protein [Dactylosporangium sp.]NNJ62813.1 hypothetical protein [Dactylosporangium sp.]